MPARAGEPARRVLRFRAPSLSVLVSLLRVGARLRPAIRDPRRQPLPVGAQRSWYPTSQAAAMLSTSERTLRRRISKAHWKEGLHYRWIVRQTRATLEINVPQVLKLMEEMGWA